MDANALSRAVNSAVNCRENKISRAIVACSVRGARLGSFCLEPGFDKDVELGLEVDEDFRAGGNLDLELGRQVDEAQDVSLAERHDGGDVSFTALNGEREGCPELGLEVGGYGDDDVEDELVEDGQAKLAADINSQAKVAALPAPVSDIP